METSLSLATHWEKSTFRGFFFTSMKSDKFGECTSQPGVRTDQTSLIQNEVVLKNMSSFLSDLNAR